MLTYKDYLKKIISSLSAEPNQGDYLERPLRLYQLKSWLTWESDDILCFTDAAAEFTALAVSRRASLIQKGDPTLTPSSAIRKVLNRPRYASLFDESFGRDFRKSGLLYGLCSADSIHEMRTARQEHVGKLECLDYLTELRLRLSGSEFACTLDNAFVIYAKTLKKTRLLYKVPGLKIAERHWRNRIAFLYAAKSHPWIIEVSGSKQGTWRLLRQQSSRTDDLKSYFATCAGIENSLARSDRTFKACGSIEKWAGIKGVSVPVTPVTKKEQDDLKIRLVPRRGK